MTMLDWEKKCMHLQDRLVIPIKLFNNTFHVDLSEPAQKKVLDHHGPLFFLATCFGDFWGTPLSAELFNYFPNLPGSIKPMSLGKLHHQIS